MNTVPDRLHGSGRRQTDQYADDLRVLVHDIGHAVATANCLVDAALVGDLTEASARRKLELIRTQTRTLSALVQQAIHPTSGGDPLPVRSLLAELTEQADATGPASVTLADGPGPVTDLDIVALWRILFNLIANAARAAGGDGTVSVAITGMAPIMIEIADDGPGFGLGEPGWASLGLTAVARLSRALGVEVSFESREPVGTLARVTLPAPREQCEGAGSGRGSS